jgi:2-desacetyl-2-hydroxyethyl bacteriochlorophyllide A dehydrogenase
MAVLPLLGRVTPELHHGGGKFGGGIPESRGASAIVSEGLIFSPPGRDDMKAMLLQGPRELRLGEVEKPAASGDKVLVQITHSAICGTDLKIFEGEIPVAYPRIMGHEMCGEVIAGGDGTLRPGTRVMVDPSDYCGVCPVCYSGRTSICPNGVLLGRDRNGGFAEYMAVPQRFLFPIPDSIDYETAPSIQVATTCLHSQRTLNIFPGQTVVVMGLGVSGQIHAQMAKARGATVIGVTRSAWKRQMAEKLGCDLTLASGPEAERGVLEATHGLGADIVIESTGKLVALASSIKMARRGGALLCFGIITQKEGALPFYDLYFKELTVTNARAAKSEDFPATIEMVAKGHLNLKALVTHKMPLPELAPAIKMLEADIDGRMKVIIDHTN